MVGEAATAVQYSGGSGRGRSVTGGERGITVRDRAAHPSIARPVGGASCQTLPRAAWAAAASPVGGWRENGGPVAWTGHGGSHPGSHHRPAGADRLPAPA